MLIQIICRKVLADAHRNPLHQSNTFCNRLPPLAGPSLPLLPSCLFDDNNDSALSSPLPNPTNIYTGFATRGFRASLVFGSMINHLANIATLSCKNQEKKVEKKCFILDKRTRKHLTQSGINPLSNQELCSSMHFKQFFPS
jgi:hypothetical protein